MSAALPPDTAALTTPVGWTDGEGVLLGANPALARWLGVSARRLPGLPLAALEADGDLLARGLRELTAEPGRDVLRLRRLALAQQVAREHRGSLVYRSRPGHTVFTLLLPIALEIAAHG